MASRDDPPLRGPDPPGAGGGARRVTIAGGGVAALEAVLALRALVPDLEIELLAPGSEFELRPVAVLEPFALAETPDLRLDRFAEEQRLVLVRDTLTAVHPEDRTIGTGEGRRRPFDLLLIATGAIALDGIPGAHPFRGRSDYGGVALLLEQYDRRELRRLVFAVPSHSAWTLPVYELALLASRELRERGVDDAELTIVTPEPAALAVFGRRASAEVEKLLAQAGVELKTSIHPHRFTNGVLSAGPGAEIPADRVIALPRLVGPRFEGLPHDREGFIPTDEHGAVSEVEGVYAAGDITTFPIKQGGIACQQADAAAQAIAARAGAAVEPEPFVPVLRGLLLSGTTARYLESKPTGGGGEGAAPRFALWEPTSKVFGRHLLPYLWERVGHSPSSEPATEDAVPVDFEPWAANSFAAAEPESGPES